MKKLIELIKNSDLPRIQKLATKGFVERNQEREDKEREERKLIKLISDNDNVSEILYSTDEVKIYSIHGKGEWDIKYPIRSIYRNEKGDWRRTVEASSDFDTAFLGYLQKKYLGSNTDFVYFACKMLGIKTED